MNPYAELGVAENATPQEIKAAYRRLAAKHHPDREGGDHDKFVRIQKAYETLSDEDKRAHYDRTGEPEKEREANPMTLISEIFLMVTNNCDPEHDDLIGLIKAHLKKAWGRNAKEIKGLRVEAKKWRQIARRIQSRAEHNPLRYLSEKNREQILKAYLHARKERRMIDRCKDALEGWTYECEPKVPTVATTDEQRFLEIMIDQMMRSPRKY